MENLQGPINPCLFEEHVDERCLEERKPAQLGLGCYQLLTSEEEEEEAFTYTCKFQEYSSNEQLQLHQIPPYTLPRLEDKMPFLQMLQGVEEHTPFSHDPNFQLLLKLQDHDQNKSTPWNTSYELESCVTSEIVDFYCSPPKSEAVVHETMGFNLSSECNQMQAIHSTAEKPPPSCKDQKRKRKRSRVSKNKDEVETQRMTHIAVERNRRRQMNDHLNALRSLMPSSYIQRGDQASIIGGAIDFVKELEQMLRSLQAQKRMRYSEVDSNVNAGGDVSTSTSSSNPQQLNNNNNDGTSSSADLQEAAGAPVRKEDGFTAETRSPEADVDVVVIHNHVNLKIQCQRRPAGQLIRAILAFEDLRLTVLHLNITSLETSIHYSFNLKIEDECNLRSAAEIAGAVHQIFSHSSNLEN